MDIKKLIGQPVISNEEKVVSKLVANNYGNIVIYLMNFDDGTNEFKSTYEQLLPMIDQVLFELKEDKIQINEYSRRSLRNTANDIDAYAVTENTDSSSRGILVIGTIEKWLDITYTETKGKISYILTLNFSQINNVSNIKMFTTDDLQTLQLLTVPLTAHGVLDDIGGKTTIYNVLRNMNREEN